jgi:hypothetical protein
MTKAETTRVVNATVHLDRKGGQGVLVPRGFILTAAHCIKWSGTGRMALGDPYIESVTTKSGARFRVVVYAVDPVSDIAILGSLNCQDRDQFEQWYEATPAVPVASTTPRSGAALHILTHRGKWVGAKTIKYNPAGHLRKLPIETDDRIRGGTSGGPVVDTSGRLIGVVSWFGEEPDGKKCTGDIPIARLALPGWAWLLIGPSKRSVSRAKLKAASAKVRSATKVWVTVTEPKSETRKVHVKVLPTPDPKPIRMLVRTKGE